VKKSVLEIFREDIARFRVVLASGFNETPLDDVRSGKVPALSALRMHNGTVYRWNRACYGAVDGIAHIRIENRALPAGPTVLDEVANASFFFGLMAGMGSEFDDIGTVMRFDDAKSNFLLAARYGLGAQFEWVDGRTVPARELILDTLLPVARKGLLAGGIDQADIDRYLGVIEARVESRKTGAKWMLDAYAALSQSGNRDQNLRTLASATIARQELGDPVHTWSAVDPLEMGDWRDSYARVGQFMTTDVFTVRPHDLVNLAASLMEWEHIKHVPVENDEGHLVGLVSSRAFLRLVARGLSENSNSMVPVQDIMKTHLVTASPDTTTVQAIEMMRRHRVGCLPVVEGDRLVGIVTEHDFLNVAGMLMEQQLLEVEDTNDPAGA
jgi:CBS domain-containing protein